MQTQTNYFFKCFSNQCFNKDHMNFIRNIWTKLRIPKHRKNKYKIKKFINYLMNELKNPYYIKALMWISNEKT